MKNIKLNTIDYFVVLYLLLGFFSGMLIRGLSIDNPLFVKWILLLGVYWLIRNISNHQIIQKAINDLQEETVLTVDGFIGVQTIAALKTVDHVDVYNLFLEYRKQHYYDRVESRPSQEEFLNGWLNRTNSFNSKTESQKYNVNC